MQTLDDVQNVLFTVPPIRVFYFGSDKELGRDEKFLLDFFQESPIPQKEVKKIPLAVQRTLAAGLHPIILVRFGIVFQKNLCGEKCLDILETLSDPVEYAYWIAYGSLKLVNSIAQAQTPMKNNHLGITRINSQTQDTEFFFDVKKGERLYQLQYTANPLPGCSISTC